MRVSFVLRSAEESSETLMHCGQVKNRNVTIPIHFFVRPRTQHLVAGYRVYGKQPYLWPVFVDEF